MAEGADQADLSDEAARRGSLTIADRVVERIAGEAARRTDGVATAGSALEQVIGRRYPRVEAEVAGGRVRITVEIATLWPVPLATTTAKVRTAVSRDVESLVGLHVDSVDVHAGKVVHDPRKAT